MRVRLSRAASRFLRDEARYLRDRSPAAAARLLERMGEARRLLADFPSLGSLAEEGLVPGTRRLVVGDYVLFYEVSGVTVAILAIRHGRMQAPSPAAEPDFDYEAGPDRAGRS